MSDINIPVKWKYDTDMPYQGVYLVAVRYPNGFGAYDFTVWNGQEWELGYTAEIVGWAHLNDVLYSLKSGWPEKDQEIDKEFEKRYLERKKQEALQGSSDDEEDNWIELE